MPGWPVCICRGVRVGVGDEEMLLRFFACAMAAVARGVSAVTEVTGIDWKRLERGGAVSEPRGVPAAGGCGMRGRAVLELAG